MLRLSPRMSDVRVFLRPRFERCDISRAQFRYISVYVQSSIQTLTSMPFARQMLFTIPNYAGVFNIILRLHR